MPLFSVLESLVQNVISLIEDKIQLYKLKAIDKLSGLVSALLTAFILAIVFLVFIIVFNIGIALLIGYYTGKSYLGFLIVAAFYAIVGLLIFVNRKKLMRILIVDRLIRKLTSNGSSEDK